MRINRCMDPDIHIWILTSVIQYTDGGVYQQGGGVSPEKMTALSGEPALFVPGSECNSPVLAALCRDTAPLKPPYWGTLRTGYYTESTIYFGLSGR